MEAKKGTFAIQQLSSAVMHTLPCQPKYYITIQLSSAGLCQSQWQGYVCRWPPIIKLAQDSKAHKHCNTASLSLPSFNHLFSSSSPSLHPPGKGPAAGTFTSDLSFTSPSNWITHSGIRSPLIKRGLLWIKMLRRTHFSTHRGNLMYSVTSSNEVRARVERERQGWNLWNLFIWKRWVSRLDRVTGHVNTDFHVCFCLFSWKKYTRAPSSKPLSQLFTLWCFRNTPPSGIHINV